MAGNEKVTQLTENTAPLGGDLEYMVDMPGGTPLSQKIYKGSNNLLYDGAMVNGDFSVTVASNNLTVALKTKSGGNPSATDPVSIWLGGAYRRCTATLSKTFNAGTNWAGLGGVDFATIEQDLFLYAIWNTTPGTDIFDIGWSRVPYGRVYSDFSGSSTAETYLGYANASAPAATDNVAVIGRFAATLSGTAAFNWSVPTYTNVDFIRHPIFETRWRTWTPTLTGFSANPTLVASYRINRDRLEWIVNSSAVGTSNATTATMTMPFASANVANLGAYVVGRGQDNGAECSPTFRISANTNVMETFKGPGVTAWTNSGNKFFSGEGFYRLK